MNIDERPYQHYVKTGRHFWMYSILLARLIHWWHYATPFERWTVRVAVMLVAIMAGLVLAGIIGG